MKSFTEYTSQEVTLYNASAASIKNTGFLEPHISNWVREVAYGAVDSDDDIENYTHPLVYLSDNLKWVKMITARLVKKHVTEVTNEDIEKYGRLNIVKLDIDSEEVFKVGDYAYDGKVTNLRGERVYHPELNELPIGPEPDDYIAHEALEIHKSLTGKELSSFLKNAN